MGELTSLREVKYRRLEYLREPTVHKSTLLNLVYDIPYFGACGVFPPVHIANWFFLSGGADGGMSPGATWEPFTVSQNEYDALVRAVQLTPVLEIKPHARYAFLAFSFDHSFDHIVDGEEWLKAVCEKHRNGWHKALRKAGAMS